MYSFIVTVYVVNDKKYLNQCWLTLVRSSDIHLRASPQELKFAWTLLIQNLLKMDWVFIVSAEGMLPILHQAIT